MARRRTSMGRQRIEIRRIVNDDARQVCFSKRRAGLFNKASELAILCGVEVAAVVFSPAGRAFSFGHPSVEAIIHRFDPTGLGAGVGGGAGAGEENRQLAELNRRYGELRARLDAEKVRKERAEAAMSKELAAASPVAAWLGADVRDLGKEELMAYAAVLQEVQTAVAARANQMIQDAANHGRAMAARARARSSAHNNNQVLQSLPQQFLLANNGAVGFLYPFGAGSAYNNGAEMEMQIQQMLMAMTPLPPPGFGGFFPGPY